MTAPHGELSPPEQIGENFSRLAKQPQNIGIFSNPSGKGMSVGQCGDSIEVFLRIFEGTIADISVAPRGCVYTLVCASAMSELVKGMGIDEALYLEPDEVAAALGGLPEDHMHCARLAVNTLGEALADYHKNAADDKGRGGM